MRPADSFRLSNAALTVAPDPEFDALLAKWRLRGSGLVADHWREFEVLVERLPPLIQQRRYADAATAAQIAANHAVFWHPGCFSSTRLENLIRQLGEAALPAPGPAPRALRGRIRVLHVASQVKAVGGHARMIWRWISQDSDNQHSVALTRDTRAVPEPLRVSVDASGGRISYVNRRPGGPLEWAVHLQELFSIADLVVLHVDNQDIVPFLALGGLKRRSRVILLNHADHVFWLGAGFVDIVVNTRKSGLMLSEHRRGIAPDRNLLLPLSLEPVDRQLSRPAAKRALGLPEDSMVILTIARAVKYRPLGSRSYAGSMLPVLRTDRRIHLLAVGPGGSVDWSDAELAVPGQIHAFRETPETKTFYEAADIFVDSFPFPSNTSLLEAGLYGLPLVTRYPFGSGCEVLGADSLGIDDVLQRTLDLRDFRQKLQALAGDSGFRSALGEETEGNIRSVNTGASWMQSLRNLYEASFDTSPLSELPEAPVAPRYHDIDLFSPFVFGKVLVAPSPEARLAHSLEIGLKTMPMHRRFPAWAGMAWRRDFVFRSGVSTLRTLVPEWLTVRVRGLGS